MSRKILQSDREMIYTDGNTYGRTIYLADGMDEKDFYQITESEYEALNASCDGDAVCDSVSEEV